MIGELCPLHGLRHCDCTNWYVREAQLGRPYAVGGYECPEGHREVGSPVESPNGAVVNCGRCGGRFRLVSVAIWEAA